MIIVWGHNTLCVATYFFLLVELLEYILEKPFVKFWAEITKDSQVIDFLDAFLLNVRKKNDVYKLQAGVIDSLGIGSR